MSSGSLHSSSTLLASTSPNNSICEVTDIETDCPSGGEDACSLLLDPPQVSISSADSAGNGSNADDFKADSSSISIYESPLSSVYETPVSSPTYATPSEGRSPWASPRTSLRSADSVSLQASTNSQPPQRGDVVNHGRPFNGYKNHDPGHEEVAENCLLPNFLLNFASAIHANNCCRFPKEMKDSIFCRAGPCQASEPWIMC